MRKIQARIYPNSAHQRACLLAGEVKVLLSDMGHDYEEEEIQKALSLVAPQVPGKVDAGIEFQDFCEVAFLCVRVHPHSCPRHLTCDVDCSTDPGICDSVTCAHTME